MPQQYHRTIDQERERVVEYFETEEEFVSLAHNLGIRRPTAYSIVRLYLYQQQGCIASIRQAGGRANHIANETLHLIIFLMEANPLIKLREIKVIVRELWLEKQHFAENTLSRALDREFLVHNYYLI